MRSVRVGKECARMNQLHTLSGNGPLSLGALVVVSPLFASSPQNTPQLATGDE